MHTYVYMIIGIQNIFISIVSRHTINYFISSDMSYYLIVFKYIYKYVDYELLLNMH